MTNHNARNISSPIIIVNTLRNTRRTQHLASPTGCIFNPRVKIYNQSTSAFLWWEPIKILNYKGAPGHPLGRTPPGHPLGRTRRSVALKNLKNVPAKKMMKTSPSPSDVPSKQDKPASNLPIKQPSASQPGEKPKPGPKAAKPQKKRAKTLKKRPEKRPFGSIRCRSVRLHIRLGVLRNKNKNKNRKSDCIECCNIFFSRGISNTVCLIF